LHLPRPFGTGVLETPGTTGVHAKLLGHRVGVERVTGQRTAIGSFGVTTRVGPSGREGFGCVHGRVVVKGHNGRTTTLLVHVTTTVHRASAVVEESGVGTAVSNSTVASTLDTVLDTGERETVGLAVGNTSTDSHLGVVPVQGVERSAVGGFSDTSSLGVTGRDDRLEIGVVGSFGVVGNRRLRAGTDPQGVVTRELGDGVAETDILVDVEVLGLASGCRRSVENWLEWFTVAEDTSDSIVTRTLVDGLLEETRTVVVCGPTVDEVSVHTVTGRVTVREDPRRVTTLVVREVLDSIDELVEERDESNGVGGRTLTTIDTSRWPGHVGYVVGRVKVDTVPTRTEEDLRSHTVGTVMVEKVVSLRPLWIARVAACVIETDVGDSLGVGVAHECSAHRASRDHAETVRERTNLAVLARTGKVVGVDDVDGDELVGRILGVVVIQLRGPVVGLVLRDRGRRALRRTR